MEKRALSWQEFLDSGFDGRDYNFPDFEGTFEAEMVCKRWDKNSKLLVYLDFDDGRKIITSAWQDSNYKGLADVPFNTRVRVTFQYSKKGISYVSKLLGKETIDTNTYGRSRGRNGSYSTNYQLTGRELMTPDEVRMLDNQHALLFIRGERPVQDFKYDILHHPNVRETTDGGAPAFTHGEDTRSIAAMSFVFDKNVVKQAQEIKPELHDFELLSEEELQEIFDKKEKEEHEKHQS